MKRTGTLDDKQIPVLEIQKRTAVHQRFALFFFISTIFSAEERLIV